MDATPTDSTFTDSAQVSDDIAAVDCHAHAFHRGLSFAAARRFTPDYDAPAEAYLAELDRHDIASGVLVALSVLGTDNRYLLEALRLGAGRLRGVVAVDPLTDLPLFEDFARAGVVGVRVNLTGDLPVPAFGRGAWAEVVSECARRDWHVEINDRCARLSRSIEPLLARGVRVVIDHFGMPDRQSGAADPAYPQLLAAAASRRVWVKLSGDFRFGPAHARACAELLLQAFGPQRLVWASDWPFTQHEASERYAAQLAKLSAWVPDPAQRRTVLESTPAELFQFESARQPSPQNARP